MKLFFGLFLIVSLNACTSTGLYSWGDYQNELYTYYEKPDQRNNVITRLEKHVDALEAKSLKVPPGLYAELGTFYFEMGDQMRAVEFYKKEMAAWPESQGLMNALIANLAARPVKEEGNDAL